MKSFVSKLIVAMLRPPLAKAMWTALRDSFPVDQLTHQIQAAWQRYNKLHIAAETFGRSELPSVFSLRVLVSRRKAQSSKTSLSPPQYNPFGSLHDTIIRLPQHGHKRQSSVANR